MGGDTGVNTQRGVGIEVVGCRILGFQYRIRGLAIWRDKDETTGCLLGM